MNRKLLWAEVDLEAIAHNTRELKRIIGPDVRLMVAVKADGYGHGAVAVSQTALAHGAAALGVARIEEGIALREAGLDCPILIFGYTLPDSADQLVDFDLQQTIYDMPTAVALSRGIGENRGRLRVHFKLDTGMGRLGMLGRIAPDDWPGSRYTQDAVAMIKGIAQLQGLRLEGIFTHFASSDSRDKGDAERQFCRFSRLLTALQAGGISIPVRHAANSGAIIDMPHTHLDMVRAGISFYGLYPSTEILRDRIDLKPAMSLKARVIHLKKVPAGFAVSYNSTWRSSRETTIATVPVGYADGYSRGLSNLGSMLVHGQRAPIIGRVCMDLTLLDVGHIQSVAVGDEVVIFGRQGDRVISADEVAGHLQTINYEIVSALTARVPRIYLNASDSK